MFMPFLTSLSVFFTSSSTNITGATWPVHNPVQPFRLSYSSDLYHTPVSCFNHFLVYSSTLSHVHMCIELFSLLIDSSKRFLWFKPFISNFPYFSLLFLPFYHWLFLTIFLPCVYLFFIFTVWFLYDLQSYLPWVY